MCVQRIHYYTGLLLYKFKMSKRLATLSPKGATSASGSNKKPRVKRGPRPPPPSWFEEMKKEIGRLPKDIVQIVMDNYLYLVLSELRPGRFQPGASLLVCSKAITAPAAISKLGGLPAIRTIMFVIQDNTLTKEDEEAFFRNFPDILLPSTYTDKVLRERYFGDYKGLDWRTNLYSDEYRRLKAEDWFGRGKNRLWQFQDNNERNKRNLMRARVHFVSDKDNSVGKPTGDVYYESLPVMLNPWMFFLHSYKSLMDPSKVRREVGIVKNMFKEF